MPSDQPYIIVSADTHAGADLQDYKPYLASRWYPEFDDWAATFSDSWSEVDKNFTEPGSDEKADPDLRFGVSSFLSPVNWESDRRLAHLEGEGIAAEVLYPNTIPPFYPSGAITAPGPRDDKDYARRWAGVQAHNRWLVDFCNLTPGRRIGLAQVFLLDVDDAIAEARWAKENGLKGVLLPPDHFLGLNQWFLPKYDPFWRVCQELDLPVHSHTTVPSEAASPETGDASPALGCYEVRTFAQRPLAHFILGGVFERFPGLQLVMTEGFAAWAPPSLQLMDMFADAARSPRTIPYSFANAAVSNLSKRPSEYFATNCHIASFLDATDVTTRHETGVDRVMWGADYPHHEGTWPYTREALRATFANFDVVPEDEIRKILALNAIALYSLELPLLREVADRIGPRPSELIRPLADEEWPADSPCGTFLEIPMAGIAS
jgi:predicted TIM-barrel fold metal-dependent hydrolase